MLIDARTLPDNHIVETEVCVVGTGPAGLSLAREFLNQGFRVCLLESGGLDLPDDQTNTLAQVKTATEFEQVAVDGRGRRFGGNSGYWGIQFPDGKSGLRHRPLDDVDFEQRDWIPHSGWPINRQDLLPYYKRAHATLQMGQFSYEGYEGRAWADAHHPELSFAGDGQGSQRGDRITTHMFQFSVGKVFHETYRHVMQQADNITTYLHATVAALETDATARTVTRARVKCFNNRQFWVSAQVFVLATGGVESAQLLLLSNQTQKQGLGNQHDLVGRFFMDHPLVYGGLFIPRDRRMFQRMGLYDLRQVNGQYIMGTLGLTNEVMRREKLVNISASLFPRSKYGVMLPAKQSLQALLHPRSLTLGSAAQHAKTVLAGLGDLTHMTYGKLTRQPKPYWYTFFKGGWSEPENLQRETFHLFEVVHQTEQLPHPDNRVMLSQELDPLGRQRVLMDTRWRQADIEGIMRAQDVLAQEIARSGLGRFKIFRHENQPLIGSHGTAHHMGTTRMHIDPKQGVVDPNCQVHGVSNLFVASSAVFPTGGFANPTLTIVALSIRLADHIKVLMNRSIEFVEMLQSSPQLSSSSTDQEPARSLSISRD